MLRSLVTYVLLCFLIGCAPTITRTISKSYAPLFEHDSVEVYNLADSVRQSYEELGTIKIENGGFTTDCFYADVLEVARREARSLGGNALKITHHDIPETTGGCHHITAKILRIENIIVQNHSTAGFARGVDFIPVRDNNPSWRFAVGGGWSYHSSKLTNYITTTMPDYAERLKQGFHLEGDATYFFSERFGAGIKYSFSHNANNQDSVYYVLPDSSKIYGTLKDNITFHFIAPTFTMRTVFEGNNNILMITLAPGLLYVKNSGALINNLTSTSVGYGLATGFGYDIALPNSFSIGTEISLLVGVLGKTGIDYQGPGIIFAGDHKAVTRFDASIGLRYYY